MASDNSYWKLITVQRFFFYFSLLNVLIIAGIVLHSYISPSCGYRRDFLENVGKGRSTTTGDQDTRGVLYQDQCSLIRSLVGSSNNTNTTIVTTSPESNNTNVLQGNSTVKEHALSRNKSTKYTLPENKTPAFKVMISEGKINQTCDPVTKIIFIKTQKTASTTVASIFQRYGYRNNLTFALPKRTHMFTGSKYFNHVNVLPIPKALAKPPSHYDVLTNHAVYYRPEMDKVVPNATYITILRHPVTQLESAFGYFEMAKDMGLSNNSKPFWSFMQNPLSYYKNYKNKDARKMQIQNGQLHNLGFNPELLNDTSAIRAKIDALDKELDLVLITEYLDESLILLKRRLCWNFDDILYISAGIRSASHRYNISESLKRQICQWNSADMELYNHFNLTLWRKVRDYGPEFQTDIEEFRRLERDTFNKCVDGRNTDQKDQREDKFVINPANSGKYCQDLLRADVQYTKLLRKLYKQKVTKISNNNKPKPKRNKPKSNIKPG